MTVCLEKMIFQNNKHFTINVHLHCKRNAHNYCVFSFSLLLGTLFVQMGNLKKGEKYLKKALALHPNHPGALNNLKVIEYYRKK